MDAARAAGRDPGAITRIVVTKFHPVEIVRELYGLGVRDVGENRQQELSEKSASVGDLDGLRWHFIGQAQTNKAKAIRAAASVVHSVDRIKIADALDAAAAADAPTLDVLLQVNLTDDPKRGGVAPAELERLAEHVERMPHPAPSRRDGGRAARRGARVGRSRAWRSIPAAFARSRPKRPGSRPV